MDPRWHRRLRLGALLILAALAAWPASPRHDGTDVESDDDAVAVSAQRGE